MTGQMRNSILIAISLYLIGCYGTSPIKDVDPAKLKSDTELSIPWLVGSESEVAAEIVKKIYALASPDEKKYLAELEGISIQSVELKNQLAHQEKNIEGSLAIVANKVLQMSFQNQKSCHEAASAKITLEFMSADYDAAAKAGLLAVAPLCIGTFGSICPMRSSEFLKIQMLLNYENKTAEFSGYGGSAEYQGSMLVGDSDVITRERSRQQFAEMIAGALISAGRDLYKSNIGLCK